MLKLEDYRSQVLVLSLKNRELKLEYAQTHQVRQEKIGKIVGWSSESQFLL